MRRLGFSFSSVCGFIEPTALFLYGARVLSFWQRKKGSELNPDHSLGRRKSYHCLARAFWGFVEPAASFFGCPGAFLSATRETREKSSDFSGPRKIVHNFPLECLSIFLGQAEFHSALERERLPLDYRRT